MINGEKKADGKVTVDRGGGAGNETIRGRDRTRWHRADYAESEPPLDLEEKIHATLATFNNSCKQER